MAYSTIIFDLDGTLVDTSKGILDCIRQTERQFGFEPLPDEIIRTFIGPPILGCFLQHYGVSREQADQMLDYYRSIYWQDGLTRGSVYPGCRELLQTLRQRGCKLGVATMKVEHFALRNLTEFDLLGSFDMICGYSDELKPTKAQLIQRCLQHFGVTDHSTVLMVGDSTYDAEGAFVSGVDYAAMAEGLGYQNPEDLERFPSVVQARSYAELSAFLLPRIG